MINRSQKTREDRGESWQVQVLIKFLSDSCATCEQHFEQTHRRIGIAGQGTKQGRGQRASGDLT